MKTCFEKYLKESLKKFDKIAGTWVSPADIMTEFFPIKVATIVNKLEIDEDRKTAIILLGPACSRKPAFARKFIAEHKDFVFISLDKCAAEDMNKEMEKSGIIVLDSLNAGNRAFDEMLSAGHKKIIIEGGWLHFNARGALLKALTDYDYHTIICFMNPKDDFYDTGIADTIFDFMACDRLHINPFCLFDGEDVISRCAEETGCTAHELKSKMRLDARFKKKFNDELNALLNEFEDADFAFQLENQIYLYGADEFIFMDT